MAREDVHRTARDLAAHPLVQAGDMVRIEGRTYAVGTRKDATRYLELTYFERRSQRQARRVLGSPSARSEEPSDADLATFATDLRGLRTGFDAAAGHHLAARLMARPDIAVGDAWTVDGHRYEVTSVRLPAAYGQVKLGKGLTVDGAPVANEASGIARIGADLSHRGADVAAFLTWRQRHAVLTEVQALLGERWAQGPPRVASEIGLESEQRAL